MKGKLTVICGSMFSGKSEEMIRRLRRAKIAGTKVLCFKPQIDDRYSKDKIVSHSQYSFESIDAKDTNDLLNNVQDINSHCVVGIDEIQFFSTDIIKIIIDLVDRGIDVIVSGLDLDYKNVPFQVTAHLMAYADYVQKLTAICVKCHGEATKTYKKNIADSGRIAVGGAELYEARCSTCHSFRD